MVHTGLPFAIMYFVSFNLTICFYLCFCLIGFIRCYSSTRQCVVSNDSKKDRCSHHDVIHWFVESCYET